MALRPYKLSTSGVYAHSNGVYPKSTSSVTIVDDFEDGGISEYAGDTGSFSVTTNSPQNGSYRLETTNDPYAEIRSTSGLNAYPQQGDRFRVWVRTGDGSASASYVAVLFGVQDSSNFYYVRPRPGNDDIQLRSTGGAIASAAVTVATATWYEIEVEWDDGSTFGGNAGDMNVTMYDSSGSSLVSFSGNDNTWASGGIGWGVPDTPGGGDYYRITNR